MAVNAEFTVYVPGQGWVEYKFPAYDSEKLDGKPASDYATRTYLTENYQPKGNYSLVGHTHPEYGRYANIVDNTTSNTWCKVADIVMPVQYVDKNIVFLVMQNNPPSQKDRIGILQFGIRNDNASSIPSSNVTLQWLVKTTNFDNNWVVAVIDGLNVSLWCKATTIYSGVSFQVLTENRTNGLSINDFTVYNSATPQASLPAGTQVVSKTLSLDIPVFGVNSAGLVPGPSQAASWWFLKADGTWGSLPYASQTDAENGSRDDVVMSPIRVTQTVNSRIAAETDARAGTDNTKIMTPLRVMQTLDDNSLCLAWKGSGLYTPQQSGSTVRYLIPGSFEARLYNTASLYTSKSFPNGAWIWVTSGGGIGSNYYTKIYALPLGATNNGDPITFTVAENTSPTYPANTKFYFSYIGRIYRIKASG